MKIRKINILFIVLAIVCICIISACGKGEEKPKTEEKKQTEEDPKEEKRSAWEVVGSVDEFGDPDEDEAAIMSVIKGTFTNSAVTDEDLIVKTYISPNAGKINYNLSFYLYEYNDQKATFLSSDELTLKTKIDDVVKEDYEVIGKAPMVLVGDALPIVHSLQGQKEVKCVLYIGSTSKYSFTIPFEGINDAIADIDIWGKDHAQAAQKEADDIDGPKLKESAEKIKLGKYEQDDNKENGDEDIEWYVIDEQKDKVLVLSKTSLEVKPFNEESTPVTWEKSSLRQWLNEDFYKTAFTEKEQKQIIQTTVKNNTEEAPTSGNDTEDKVFILSRDEFLQYLNVYEEWEPSPYAEKKFPASEVETNANWTRSSTKDPKYATFITWSDKAKINRYAGCDVSGLNYVRPAMWIKKK